VFYNLYNKLGLVIHNPAGYDFSAVQDRFGRFACSSIGGTGVSKKIHLSVEKNIEGAALTYLGKEAAFDSQFYILDSKGFKLRYDPHGLLGQSEIVVERGFNTMLLNRVLESYIFISLTLLGVTPVHSCSVKMNGEGVLFPAWAGTGKTRLIMNLTDTGATYLSDEWTIVDGDMLLPYSDDIAMLDYDLHEYGHRVKLSFIDRVRVSICSKIHSKPLKAVLNRFKLVLMVKQIKADRVFSKVGTEAKFKRIYQLERGSGLQAQKMRVDDATLVKRMYQSFKRENSLLYYYNDLHEYAFPTGGSTHISKAIREKYTTQLMQTINDRECFRLVLPKNLKGCDIGSYL